MAQEHFLNPPMPDVIASWKFYLEQLDIKPGDSVLDVGCNTGDTEHFLISLFPFVNKVVGLDYDENRIAVAKETWESKGKNEKIEFIQGDGSALPFNDNTFDKIICAETLEWIKDPKTAIKEIKRVLKPNGIALIQHTDWDQTVYTTTNIEKTRLIIQSFGDSGPDGIIGRRLLVMCKQVGFNKVSPLVYTMINDKFEEPYYSFKLAKMIKDWLLTKKIINNEELESWISELKEMSLNDEFYFSINRNICVCYK
ncbi:methyltransferase domain-containing protein [Bacillus solitudinis]|uniref:methyltransferase domain-containing protein n=1 Tax=Bacillus solitudinis TaxID=2014074 RepID=UPI000C23EB65|nr:methyltransferase domain-containing protein [Bacillus solitudinis]